MAEVDPNINPPIWTAIERKRLLRFRYKGRERIVEPHNYGIHQGLVKLFGYQVDGSSSHKLPNLRWAEQDLISHLQLLGPNLSWRPPDQIGQTPGVGQAVHFIRVKSPGEDQK